VTDPDAKKEAAVLIKSITTALGALTAVPKGGTRSPLALASVYELIVGSNPKISHILLVKAQPGSASELVDQRFMVKDKVLMSASMSITYMLINAHGHILTAGTETATIEAHGSIEDAIKLQAREVEHLVS
jgi:hypothetical protein